MKIIPVYLPQFHIIPENDEWWGKDFTEWTNVRKARPLFKGHYQPRVPLDKNYYDLNRIETLKWQCELARKYGIYGFCFYHYWFNGHLLLEKPMEMLLTHPEIDINYCVSWANHDWTDGWKASKGRATILISHDFDDEKDWVNHFHYLLPFFRDQRYMKEENKPLMVIYIPNLIRKLNKMLDLWNQMAIEAGFDGLAFIYQSAGCCFDNSWDRSKFTYGIEFQPGFVGFKNGKSRFFFPGLIKYSHQVKAFLRIKKSFFVGKEETVKENYDETWRKILEMRPSRKNMIPSAFVDWDNTPRRPKDGSVYIGANPEKFEKYFRQLVQNARDYYHQDKIFVFAWNEWTEGGYLEPDEKYSYGYLEAIHNVLKETNEQEHV